MRGAADGNVFDVQASSQSYSEREEACFFARRERAERRRCVVITLRGVTKVFGRGEKQTVALDNVSLEVKAGEIFGIIGLSGAGKSTLVRCINMLERPQSGSIVVDGVEVTSLGERELRKERRKIGMIFQQFNLLSSRTVLGNVAFPLEIAGGLEKAAIRQRTLDLLRLVGLEDKANAYPLQLSGGQKQRVGIARALANHPKVLLSDEATSALDPQTTRSILELLADINRRLGITIILITHEMGVVRQIADRVAVIEGGRIIEEGSVVDVFTNPQAQTTRKFVQGLIAEAPVDLQRRSQQSGGSASCALLRLSFVGDAAGRPYISTVVRRFGVEANVLYGSIDRFKSAAFGTLFVELTGLARDVEEALTFLRSEGLGVEVIENVGPDAIRDAV